MRRICLVGPYSAVLNPVSLHVRRLKPILQRAGLPVTVFDTDGAGAGSDDVVSASAFLAAIRTWWSMPPSIIDLHTDRVDLRTGVAVALLASKHQVLVSLHGGASAGPTGNWSWLERTVLSWTRLVVVHDVTSQDRAQRLTWKGRIVALPEYLPPFESPAPVRPELSEFRSKHPVIIVAAAPELGIRLGGDVHGAGLLIDALQRLVHDDHLDVAVIFHVSKAAEQAPLNDIRRRLEEAAVSDRWRTVDGQPDLLRSLWSIADVFVLPGATAFGGGAQRDIMASRVPVVLSDTSEPETGVRTFRQGDASDLHRVVQEVLNSLEKSKARLDELPLRMTPDRYVQMYRSLERERIA